MTILDIDNWSKSAAKEYLTTGKVLDETIEKIASENGLNRDQLNRVVEATNTEVYVQMFNQAQDKYIQFQNADAEKIAEHLFGTEKTSQVSDEDYQEPPTSYPLNDVEAEAVLVKTAEVEPTNTTNTEALHEYYKIAALETRLEQSIDEVEVQYQHDSAVLYSMIKQAVLGGTSFGDIKYALTSVYDDPVINVNLTEAQEKISEELFPQKLDVDVRSIGTVNLENSLVKQANLLLKHAQDFKNLKAKHAETLEQLKQHIKEGGIMTGVKLVGGGALAGGIAVDQLSKKRLEQNVMKSKMQQPNAYTRI